MVNGAWAAGVALCALATGACGNIAEHSCSDVYAICNQTGITLQSSNDAWTPGTYALALTLDGTSGQCTMQVPESPPVSGVQGDCGSGVSFTLAPVESCPPVVCNSTACGGMGCTPIPGHFQMTLGVQGLPMQVGLSLSIDGATVTSETLAPTSTTTEPNGAGCGTCTNASATISVAEP